MAIRIPCDAKHRPIPEGPEGERIATGLRPRNDCGGGDLVPLLRSAEDLSMTVSKQKLPAGIGWELLL